MLELLLGAVTLGLAALASRRPVALPTVAALDRKVENGLLLRPVWEWCSPCCHDAQSQYGSEFVPPNAGIEWFFLSPDLRRSILEAHLEHAIPWHDNLKYEPEWVEVDVTYDPDDELYYDDDGDAHEEPPEPHWRDSLLVLQGATWPEFNLFPEKRPFRRKHKGSMDPIASYLRGTAPDADTYVARSPSGRWQYANRVLRRGESLPIYKFDPWVGEGVEGGQVIFDSDVVIPAVFENGKVWMSNTPFEVLSQKEAADAAHGKVVVGGLGLGWLLTRVANNPRVTEVVLVEIDPEIVDWLMPRLCARLPKGKPIHVVIGDIEKVLPELVADVALLDVWQSYSDIQDEMYALMDRTPGIDRWWGWGSDWPYGELQRKPRRRRR